VASDKNRFPAWHPFTRNIGYLPVTGKLEGSDKLYSRVLGDE
jgi:hypothetical protein